jgi:ketosteroid isomerase-like protein
MWLGKRDTGRLDTMSAKDVETVREGIAALNRGDEAAMVATLDADVELIPLRAVLEGTVYRGHEGLRCWLRDMADDWTQFEVRLQELRDLERGCVLVRATMHLRGRSSGVVLDAPAAWLCDMHDGKVRRIRFFADSDAALAAVDEAA